MATVAEILKGLVHSERGKIFLCNLEAALGIPVVDQERFRATLLEQLDGDVRFAAYDELLGAFKAFLLELSHDARRARPAQGLHEDFSPSGLIITVIRAEDFRHYRDNLQAASGHDYDDPAQLGWRTRHFDPDSKTLELFWAAPQSIVPPQIDHRSAQLLRDKLGLVHHPCNMPLIALVLRLPPNHPWHRPTILEASPNARFRQLHPQETEHRWGFTVDLEKLEIAQTGESIAGVPEIVVERVRLADCSDVEFFALGTTQTDRSTTGADKKFLAHISGDRDFEAVFGSIAELVNLPLLP